MQAWTRSWWLLWGRAPRKCQRSSLSPTSISVWATWIWREVAPGCRWWRWTRGQSGRLETWTSQCWTLRSCRRPAAAATLICSSERNWWQLPRKLARVGDSSKSRTMGLIPPSLPTVWRSLRGCLVYHWTARRDATVSLGRPLATEPTHGSTRKWCIGLSLFICKWLPKTTFKRWRPKCSTTPLLTHSGANLSQCTILLTPANVVLNFRNYELSLSIDKG